MVVLSRPPFLPADFACLYFECLWRDEYFECLWPDLEYLREDLLRSLREDFLLPRLASSESIARSRSRLRFRLPL